MGAWLAAGTLQLAASATAAPTRTPKLLVYFGVLLILVLAASTSARPFLRWMRHPIVATYAGGGWLWLALGVAIGPRALGLLEDDAIEQLRPAILVAVGWIGLTIGVQLDLRTLRGIPAIAWRWAAMDLLLSISAALAISLVAMPFWLQVSLAEGAWLAIPVITLTAIIASWNPETRSLLVRPNAAARQLGRLSSGTAALASVMMVLFYGVESQLIVRDATGTPRVSWLLGAVAFGASLLFAIAGAAAIRFLLRRGDWSMSRTLVVVLSIAALAAGFAAELAFSPLLTALFAGIAVSSIPGTLRLSIWRLLSRSERPVATLLFLLAGALLAMPASPWTLAVAVLVAGVRLLGKPLLMSLVLRGDLGKAGENRRPLLAGTMRQSALATVIVASAVVAENAPVMRDLLLIAVVAGMAGTFGTLGRSAEPTVRSMDEAPEGTI